MYLATSLGNYEARHIVECKRADLPPGAYSVSDPAISIS